MAIKRLKQPHGALFELEARAIVTLNICQIHDIGTGYLVLEDIDGQPLQGPLPVQDAIRLAIQIASALEDLGPCERQSQRESGCPALYRLCFAHLAE